MKLRCVGAHVGVVSLLAAWGHAQAPDVLGGLLPLATWLAAVALLRRAVPLAGLARRVAMLGMLPMMAGLPAMLDLCSPAVGGAAWLVAGHLGTMLLLPTLLRLLPAWCLPASTPLVAGLLLAGGGALLAWPGVQGLMLAMLAHAAAFGVAVWTDRPAAAVGSARRFDAGPAACVLALGAALDALGPQALFLAHGALAALGGLALLQWARSRRQDARPARSAPHHARHSQAQPAHPATCPEPARIA
jgi:hypothetical protein